MWRGIDIQDVELVEGDTDESHDTKYDPLEDSDYASSEDDEMIGKYVDLEVEASGWAKFSKDKIPHPPHIVKGKRVVQPIDCVDNGSDIDCVSASDFESLSSSDDGENREKRIRPKQFNPESDMENPQFKLGMLFATKEVFLKAVRMHSIVDRRDIKFVKNDKARVRATCVGSCPWKCYARKKDDEPTFEVRTFLGKHTCKKTWNTRNCSSKIVAEWYADDFASDPSMIIPNLMSRVQREKKLTISKSQGWRSKKAGLEKVRGKIEEQYAKLEDYVVELLRMNRDSSIYVNIEEDDEGNRFKRMYICWGATKKGFIDGCRHVLGLDGCHLLGPCKGILLTAVGVDPNNNQYPVAYAAVEVENKVNWKWFVQNLIEDLHIRDSHDWVIITDRQKCNDPSQSTPLNVDSGGNDEELANDRANLEDVVVTVLAPRRIRPSKCKHCKLTGHTKKNCPALQKRKQKYQAQVQSSQAQGKEHHLIEINITDISIPNYVGPEGGNNENIYPSQLSYDDRDFDDWFNLVHEEIDEATQKALEKVASNRSSQPENA